VLAAIVGGQQPGHAIVSGGGPRLADSAGQAWSGRYVVASGNLQADFQANVTAEMQGTLQATRLYNMTDDPGVRHMLRFTIARDTMHQNLWLSALEELKADGLEGLPVPPAHPFEERPGPRLPVLERLRAHRLRAGPLGRRPDAGRQGRVRVRPGRSAPGRGGIAAGADPLLYVTAPAERGQANSERPQ
jgi:Mn-containing catalase